MVAQAILPAGALVEVAIGVNRGAADAPPVEDGLDPEMKRVFRSLGYL